MSPPDTHTSCSVTHGAVRPADRDSPPGAPASSQGAPIRWACCSLGSSRESQPAPSARVRAAEGPGRVLLSLLRGWVCEGLCDKSEVTGEGNSLICGSGLGPCLRSGASGVSYLTRLCSLSFPFC